MQKYSHATPRGSNSSREIDKSTIYDDIAMLILKYDLKQ